MTNSVSILRIFIVIFFLVLRISFLLSPPPFVDETSYLFWTERMISENDITRPMRDGTGPVFMIMASPLIYLTGNFLLSGRLVSSAADLVSLLLIGKIAKKITASEKMALLAMLLFSLFPISVLHGRMAVLDSLTNMWTLLGVAILTLAAIDENFLKATILLMLSLIAGFLTKPIALSIIPFLFLVALFFTNKRYRKYSLVTVIIAIIGAAIISAAIFFPFRDEFFYLYQNYHKSGAESLAQSVPMTIFSLRREIRWLEVYLGLPVLIISLISTFFIRNNNKSLLLFSILWFLSIFFTNAVVGTANLFPRHLVQTVPALVFILVISMRALSLFNRIAGNLASIFLITSFLWSSILIITFPKLARLPKEDRYQLFEDWTSGYGLAETARFVSAKPDSQFFTDDPWLSRALYLFYGLPKGRVGFTLPPGLPNKAYIIMNRNLEPPSNLSVEKVWLYHHPPRREINIYRVLAVKPML